jgi:hypothetical protein
MLATCNNLPRASRDRGVVHGRVACACVSVRAWGQKPLLRALRRAAGAVLARHWDSRRPLAFDGDGSASGDAAGVAAAEAAAAAPGAEAAANDAPEDGSSSSSSSGSGGAVAKPSRNEVAHARRVRLRRRKKNAPAC